MHGLVFQAVMAPNGIIIDWFGPLPASNNDLNLVHWSGIVAGLTGMFTLAGLVFRYRCYGDSIYMLSTAISRRYRAGVLTAQQVREREKEKEEEDEDNACTCIIH